MDDQKAARYFARNVGTGLAMNVYVMLGEKLGEEELPIFEVGALGAGEERRIPDDILVGASYGSVKSHAVIAEAIIGQADERWVISLNFTGPRGLLSHRLATGIPDCSPDELLTLHGDEIKRQLERRSSE